MWTKAAFIGEPLEMAAGDKGTGYIQEQVVFRGQDGSGKLGRTVGVGTWGPGSSLAPMLTSECSCYPSSQGYSHIAFPCPSFL